MYFYFFKLYLCYNKKQDLVSIVKSIILLNRFFILLLSLIKFVFYELVLKTTGWKLWFRNHAILAESELTTGLQELLSRWKHRSKLLGLY